MYNPRGIAYIETSVYENNVVVNFLRIFGTDYRRTGVYENEEEIHDPEVLGMNYRKTTVYENMTLTNITENIGMPELKQVCMKTVSDMIGIFGGIDHRRTRVYEKDGFIVEGDREV